MRIIAIDRGDQKRELCQRLGAEEFIDRTLSEDIPAEVRRITTYGAQAVLVLPPSKEAYALAPNLVRPGGTVVVVGLPHDESVIAGKTETNGVGSLEFRWECDWNTERCRRSTRFHRERVGSRKPYWSK
jgi:D-arabinose 1-dehydrogenase-like Zn-dependent alcohol dehydrogenase